ncbi:PUA-like domain-containing protein [Gilbertella persicaria]|uniref:PUA-like domain-containing protein n=1 Tax=Gilbertella persicaria TaxID=101096 RepID=UPI00221FF78A|nr:PUA-like domain-containing protein [Gilbertella persicaria]KAI8084276.1 PUA-like domain-containing protein [Gilbertella persicaria]
MQVQLLIPSQFQKNQIVETNRSETISAFRKQVAKLIGMSEDSFLLIAFGKIMLDISLDEKPATLYHTYRVRDRTCVFVHLKPPTPNKKKMPIHVKKELTDTRPTDIIHDMNTVSTPFGDPFCPSCKNDKKKKKCSECGCVKCLLKTGDPLICDQCDSYWHYQCADLSKPPTDQYWYCPDCYNHDRELVIGKGTAIKSDAFKAPDKVREAECVLVPTYHIGKIPGIYCSQSWSNRLLVEEWGIHRAINNVVCGSVSAGAVSLILNYGFKEDKDKGYEFVCSGGGGKLKKDKCNSFAQIKGDQELIKHNLALAKTCDAPVNPIYGAQAIHWRKSQPIRVCRTSNFRRSHPDFAPKKGIRYDGLYKLVKYWPYREPTTGFIIWKFLFRRDDQEYPAWMSAGKAVMRRKGLRTIRESPQLTANLVRYRIPKRIQKLITKDKRNERMWSQIRKMEFWSEYEFLHYLFDTALACSSYACSKPIKV